MPPPPQRSGSDRLSAQLDYGRCPCNGFYDRKFVEVRLNVRAKVVVLTGVPQGTCQMCGSRVYKADVLERIESLMKGERVVHK